jgi:hypothetical protein
MKSRHWLLLAALGAPSVAMAAATAAPPSPPPAPVKSQAVKAEDVLIQGKLYSPSALFILTRPAEDFDHDVVVPHYLAAGTVPALGTSRLVPAVLQQDGAPCRRASQKER